MHREICAALLIWNTTGHCRSVELARQVALSRLDVALRCLDCDASARDVAVARVDKAPLVRAVNRVGQRVEGAVVGRLRAKWREHRIVCAAADETIVPRILVDNAVEYEDWAACAVGEGDAWRVFLEARATWILRLVRASGRRWR